MTWFIRRVARRLSLIEQVLPENPRPPCFSGVRAAQSLIFFSMFWWSLFVLLSFFYWSLYCLFVLLWFFAADYPFGIFKLFIRWPLMWPHSAYTRKLNAQNVCWWYKDGGDADNENKGKSPFLFDSGCKQKVYVQINKYINILFCWRPV